MGDLGKGGWGARITSGKKKTIKSDQEDNQRKQTEAVFVFFQAWDFYFLSFVFFSSSLPCPSRRFRNGPRARLSGSSSPSFRARGSRSPTRWEGWRASELRGWAQFGKKTGSCKIRIPGCPPIGARGKCHGVNHWLGGKQVFTCQEKTTKKTNKSSFCFFPSL